MPDCGPGHAHDDTCEIGQLMHAEWDRAHCGEPGPDELPCAFGPCGVAGQERLDWGNAGGVHVVHVRRPVNDAEQALLPAWFLACPAIDLAGMRPLVL